MLIVIRILILGLLIIARLIQGICGVLMGSVSASLIVGMVAIAPLESPEMVFS
jgi:hypothetical protein